MGYTNRDKLIVNVSAREKRQTRVLRRRAEKRELHGEHTRTARRATRRGWWYA